MVKKIGRTSAPSTLKTTVWKRLFGKTEPIWGRAYRTGDLKQQDELLIIGRLKQVPRDILHIHCWASRKQRFRRNLCTSATSRPPQQEAARLESVSGLGPSKTAKPENCKFQHPAIEWTVVDLNNTEVPPPKHHGRKSIGRT